MDLNDNKIIETIEKHNQSLDALTKASDALTTLITEDIRAEKLKNYQHLVLILGYTIYFTTWFQLREVFSKILMTISYGCMIVSLSVTVLTLMYLYFMSLIKKPLKDSWPDIVSLIFGAISILFILIASVCYIYQYMGC